MVKEGGNSMVKASHAPTKEGLQPPPESPVLRLLHKRVRNTRKKLARVEELEQLRASGTVLTPEQLPTLATKPHLVAVLEELHKLENLMPEAVREEIKVESQVAVQKHEKKLRERLEKEQQKLREEWQAEREGLVRAKEAAERAAEEAAKRDPSRERMQELLRDPLHKLLQMLYFSELFDTLKNPWLAVAEAQACLGYDQLRPSSKQDQRLTEKDLTDIVFFGRTFLARLDRPVSHKAFLELAVDMAMKWLYQPKAEAISSPPAPNRITVGQLVGRLSRVMASDFVTVTPEGGSPPEEPLVSNVTAPAPASATAPPMSSAPMPPPYTQTTVPTSPPMSAPLPPPPVPGLAAAVMSGAPPKPPIGARRPDQQPQQQPATSGAAAYVTEPSVAPAGRGVGAPGGVIVSGQGPNADSKPQTEAAGGDKRNSSSGIMPPSGPPAPGVVRGIFTPASIMTPEGPQVVPYTSSGLGGLSFAAPHQPAAPTTHTPSQQQQQQQQQQQPAAPASAMNMGSVGAPGTAARAISTPSSAAFAPSQQEQPASSQSGKSPAPTRTAARPPPVAPTPTAAQAATGPPPATPALTAAQVTSASTAGAAPPGVSGAASDGGKGGRGGEREGGRSGRNRSGRGPAGAANNARGAPSAPAASPSGTPAPDGAVAPAVKYVPAHIGRGGPRPQQPQAQQQQGRVGGVGGAQGHANVPQSGPQQQQQQQQGQIGGSGRGGGRGGGGKGGGQGSGPSLNWPQAKTGGAPQGVVHQGHQPQQQHAQPGASAAPRAPPAAAANSNAAPGGVRPQPTAAKKGGGFGPVLHHVMHAV